MTAVLICVFINCIKISKSGSCLTSEEQEPLVHSLRDPQCFPHTHTHTNNTALHLWRRFNDIQASLSASSAPEPSIPTNSHQQAEYHSSSAFTTAASPHQHTPTHTLHVISTSLHAYALTHIHKLHKTLRQCEHREDTRINGCGTFLLLSPFRLWSHSQRRCCRHR